MKKKAARKSPVRWDAARGKWLVTYWISARSGLPRSQRRRRAYADTEQAAWDRLEALRAEYKDLEERQPAIDPDIKLADYMEDWLRRVKDDYESKTYRSHVDNIRVHIRPRLGRELVRKITPGHVARMLANIRSNGYGKTERKDYSPETIRLIRSTLSVVIYDAMDDGIIGSNPCAGLNLGRRTKIGRVSRKKRQRRIRPFSKRERDTFLQAVQGQWLGPMYETMLRCGLRPGEAFALRPADVDLVRRRLRVAWSVSESGELKSTKTGDERYVHLAPYPEIVKLLRQYIPWLDDIAARHKWDDPPLFPSITGTFLDAANVRRDLKRLLKNVDDLPNDRTPYDLRHTFATHSLQVERREIGFVSAQLGHEKVSTTLDYYYHWLPENAIENQNGADSDPSTTLSATASATNHEFDDSEPERSLEVVDSQWSRRADLNRRPADYESAALPLSYVGFERGGLFAIRGFQA